MSEQEVVEFSPYDTPTHEFIVFGDVVFDSEEMAWNGKIYQTDYFRDALRVARSLSTWRIMWIASGEQVAIAESYIECEQDGIVEKIAEKREHKAYVRELINKAKGQKGIER